MGNMSTWSQFFATPDGDGWLVVHERVHRQGWHGPIRVELREELARYTDKEAALADAARRHELAYTEDKGAPSSL